MARKTVVRSTHRGTLAKARKLRDRKIRQAAPAMKVVTGTSQGKSGVAASLDNLGGRTSTVARGVKGNVVSMRQARPASAGVRARYVKAVDKAGKGRSRYSMRVSRAEREGMTDTRSRARRAGFLKSKGGATGRRRVFKRDTRGRFA